MLALLKTGDIFGEMSLLEDKPRSASAIAHEDAVLLAVNKANFKLMVTSQPQIITRLTQLLSERIWFIYKQLANTQISDNLGRMYDALSIQLEKLRVPIKTKLMFLISVRKNLLTWSVCPRKRVIPPLDSSFKTVNLKLWKTRSGFQILRK